MWKALTIAGSDSGGGAGIQADLKVFGSLGGYGLSVLTAVTAQNTLGIDGSHVLPADFVALQIDSVMRDFGADGVKTGMLPNQAIIEAVASRLQAYAVHSLVVDPVMWSTSGDVLLASDARLAFVQQMLPLAEVVTPNIPEAQALTGMTIATEADMRRAAEAIHALGARHVVVKGGHLAESAECVDILYDGCSFQEYRAVRLETHNTHGTGCTFASAIAAGLAMRLAVPEAVALAKHYVHTLLQRSADLRLGSGRGPLDHFALTAIWRSSSLRLYSA